MTDAPEIMTSAEWCDVCRLEVIPKDVALRMVAGAYEDAAHSLEDRGSDGWAENVMAEYASVNCEAIRALTPADAKAALDKLIAEAVEAAADRAANAACEWVNGTTTCSAERAAELGVWGYVKAAAIRNRSATND